VQALYDLASRSGVAAEVTWSGRTVVDSLDVAFAPTAAEAARLLDQHRPPLPGAAPPAPPATDPYARRRERRRHRDLIGAVRAGLARELPAFMLPADYVVVAGLPLNSSGKVDRSRLPEPRWSSVPSADQLAPRSPLEAQVSAVWSTVLNVPGVGVRDNFFDLGGDSLLAVRVAVLVSRRLGAPVAADDVFRHPTVEDLVRSLGDGEPPDWPAR